MERTQLRVVLVALGLLALASACDKVSSDNIQLWKTTQKGPDRLKAALADHGVEPRLRAEAAIAMTDIGLADDVDTTFSSLPNDDRLAIAKSLESLYATQMKDPSADKALAARDGLYSLRQYVSPDEQAQIDAMLLPALEADLSAGHLRQGRHSVDKMMTAIGPAAGDMLARVLASPSSQVAQAAELLGKVGSPEAREKGGAAIVARAKTANKKTPIEPLYKALGSVGGPSAVAFLESKVTGPDKDGAALAVRALQERRDPAVLPFALKVAGDAHADKIVRDEMFGVIETIGGLEARRGLLEIIANDKEEIVRYRAFESALTSAKTEGIVPALEAFPAAATYKKVDVDDLLVKLIEKLGAAARPALVQGLASKSPLARMTCLMTLEQIGKAPDAPAVEKLAGDTASVKGFPAGETIGKEAKRIAGVLEKKT
ncbi:MAG TPA: HEAT repeat domain-containing protein [Polyangia bacterium]|nr:HEAT repeat domain-containing protein [Polyangia bacterium]